MPFPRIAQCIGQRIGTPIGTLLAGQGGLSALGAVQSLAITGEASDEVADLTPTLTWSAPVDDGLGVPDSYTVRYADNALFNDSTTVAGITDTSYTLTTQPNATYLYAQVWAIRGGITGATPTAVSALMLVTVLRDDYTADAASVAGTRTPDGGGSNYTFTDTGNKLSIANQELTPTGSSTALHDPQLLGANVTRVAGLTFSFRVKVGAAGTASNAFDFGACSSAGVSNLFGFRHQGGAGTLYVRFGGNTYTVLPLTYAAEGSYDLFDVVFFASAGGAVFFNKRLVFITSASTAATLNAIVDPLNTSKKIPFIDAHLIYVNDAPLTSMANMALVNQAAPTSGSSYGSEGNAITQQMFTAEAGSLTSERGIRIRESAPVEGVDPDYWYIWFDTGGNLKAQMFLAGSAQGTATTLASGILSAGASLGISVFAYNSKVQVYTFTTSNNYAPRGAALDDGILNNNTLVTPIAGDGTLGQLWSHPVEADVYARLNPTFTPAASYSADDFGEVQQAVDTSSLVALTGERTYHFGELQEIKLHGNMRITTSGATDADWDNNNWQNWAVIHKDDIDSTYHNYSAGMGVFAGNNNPNVEIDHVIIEGEYDSLADGWLNASAGLGILANGAGCLNWHIHHVVFRNLIGFPIAHYSYASGWQVHDIYYEYCGNGINLAAPYCKYYKITFDHAEGLECTGSYAEFGLDGPIRGTNVYGGAGSFGGDQGSTVSNGIIVDDFQADTLLTNTPMFSIADNISNIEIRSGVKAYRAPFGLNVQTGSDSRPITGAKVIGMLAEECGQGFYLPGTSGCEVELDSVQAVNSTNYGLNCTDPDANVHGSSFTGSGTKDVVLQAGSAGMTFAADNTYGTIQDNR